MILGKTLFTIVVGSEVNSSARVFAVVADTIEAAMRAALEADGQRFGAANDPERFELAATLPAKVKVMKAEAVPGDHIVVVAETVH